MIDQSRYPLLSRIDTPSNLKTLSRKELKALASELRRYLLESISRSGGHLAANLGTVELTVALHYVFDAPEDKIVWDVGHQAYPHKVLTGRRDLLPTIRKKGGLAPFPKRSESRYDPFGVGHSSTSISAALGMAIAFALEKRRQHAIAVIGDGGLTGGMAFEALNHAGSLDANLLVVLNDNEMSISPNVGALTNYLSRLLSSPFYATIREGSKLLLKRMPPMWELARRAEEHMKGMVMPGTLFEELGFNYVGPIDGHDLDVLIDTLENLKKLEGPRFLHVITKKGKGYEPAERDPVTYHGVTPFDPKKRLSKKKSSKLTYTQVFSRWLVDMAERDPKLIGITPAMREGSGLVEFSERFPDRYFDVGIAEQHAVTFAAGLACEGFHPVVAIYSTFLQRAYDQLIHDVAIQNLPILFAIDRAGIVGPDGATHAGSFDLSFLRCIPNMVVMTPADEEECYRMLTTGHLYKGPAAVRYPRGTGPGVELKCSREPLPIGKAEIKRRGQRIALLAFGSMVAPALEVAERLDASCVNMRFIKPLDEAVVLEMARSCELIVTVEENAIMGGAGSAVNECLAAHNVQVPILNLGLPDRFLEHGSREELLSEVGLDAEGIERQIRRFLQDWQGPLKVAMTS